MKTLLVALFALATISVHAQVGTSPRTLTRRIEPLVRPQTPAYKPAPGAPGQPAAAAQKVLTPAEEEQKKLEQAAEDKKKLKWQMERAEKGSDNAQYQLAMRYVNGDGVEKSPKKARKWLDLSAKQGNADAKKFLTEHPELPTYDPKVDEKPEDLKATAPKPADAKKS